MNDGDGAAYVMGLRPSQHGGGVVLAPIQMRWSAYDDERLPYFSFSSFWNRFFRPCYADSVLANQGTLFLIRIPLLHQVRIS